VGVGGDGVSDEEEARGLTRVTVNLTPKAVAAMEWLSREMGFGKTDDTINRALLVYRLVADLIEAGNGALNLVGDDGKVERIYILNP
jgi:hypothetical protein